MQKITNVSLSLGQILRNWFPPPCHAQTENSNQHYHVQECNKIYLHKRSASSNPIIKNPFAVVSKKELENEKFLHIKRSYT